MTDSLQDQIAALKKENEARTLRFHEEAARIHNIPKKSFLKTKMPPIHTFIIMEPYPKHLPLELFPGEAVAFEYKCVVCGREEADIRSAEGCMLLGPEKVIVGNHI